MGHKATSMAGVKTGDGATIAAHSTVTKDVEPNRVVGGSPAREIKKRLPDEQVHKLLNVHGWHWDKEKTTANVDHLPADKLSCSTP